MKRGYQANVWPGLHFGFWPWQYAVRKVPVTVIEPGQIGLVVAADGDPIPPHRILAARVECDDFQDAHRFLTGGQKGRQIVILTAGTYRIHTVLFNVITASARPRCFAIRLPPRSGAAARRDARAVFAPERGSAVICRYSAGTRCRLAPRLRARPPRSTDP